jgi:hypothetical protein
MLSFGCVALMIAWARFVGICSDSWCWRLAVALQIPSVELLSLGFANFYYLLR